ncbi:hypothetical protein O3P69_013616 [Scylla paramamosain]|uniref:Uncharacterized protein n=1 Tax=Scylla paramamosain TaxID=85552 RepID=A0AAW0SQ87_SCYPA
MSRIPASRCLPPATLASAITAPHTCTPPGTLTPSPPHPRPLAPCSPAAAAGYYHHLLHALPVIPPPHHTTTPATPVALIHPATPDAALINTDKSHDNIDITWINTYGLGVNRKPTPAERAIHVLQV